MLWDLLPSGPQLGGAPANFACHARALGASAGVITRVGDDSRGRAIRSQLKEHGIVEGLQVDPEAPTGTVTVELTDRGVPRYTIEENAAWDSLEATTAALDAVGRADAICFGTLAQREEVARASVQRLAGAAVAESLRVFDINLRQNYYSGEVIEQSLNLANVLKLNEDELKVVAELLGLTRSVREQVELLAGKYRLRLVALTRGPGGSLLFEAGRWSDCHSRPIAVVDTVGAGDAFTAALVIGMLNGLPLDENNALANEVAGYVCSTAGATPPLPKKFAERLAGAT